jgi:hypothetical protein
MLKIYIFLIISSFFLNCKNEPTCSPLDTSCNLVGYLLPELISRNSKQTNSNTNTGTTTTTNTTSLSKNPNEISNLGFWFLADDLALADGANVTSWSDKSGNGNNLVLTIGTLNPIYKVNIIGGKSVVRFQGGSNKALTIASSTINISTNTNLSLFIVVRFSDLTSIRRIVVYGNANTAISYDGLQIPNNYFAIRLEGTTWFAHSTNLLVGSTDYLFTSTMTRNTGPGIYYNNTYLNTNLITSNSSYSGVAPQNVSQFTIGGYFDGTQNLGGDVAEVIHYTRVLTSDEILSIHCYLNSRYQINPSLVCRK